LFIKSLFLKRTPQAFAAVASASHACCGWLSWRFSFTTTQLAHALVVVDFSHPKQG
jgi:hypothetical protein